MLLTLQLLLVQALDKERDSTMESIMKSVNSPDFWFKVLILVACAPIWFPILKVLYKELDRSLRPEGGVFAKEYSAREMEQMEKIEGPYDNPLKSVPRVDPFQQGRQKSRAQAGGRKNQGGGATRSVGSTGRGVRTSRGRGF